MAIIQLPVRNDVDSFKYRIDLEGVTYSIQISWNTRDERWMIYLRDADENNIISTALVIEYDLFSRYQLSNAPPGRMFLIDPNGSREICGRFDLGERCVLLYEEAS